MSKYRLLKFDVIHPDDYLKRKQAEWKDLDTLSRKAYLERLNRLRSNYSDYYTYHLDDDKWEAEEFYLLDPVYLEKVARELYGAGYWLKRKEVKLKNKIRSNSRNWTQHVLEDYIRAYEPDVLFPRSQPIPSTFWQRFRDDTLLVARLSARMPQQWHPEHFDVLYTDVPMFKEFFERHDVPTYLNDQGFDDRVLEELDDEGRSMEVSFVGGLGNKNFRKRTHLMERVAGEIDSFRWWGYWWPYGRNLRPMSDFPNLKRTFQGPTSGLEMFQIYHDTQVVLNDYVDTAGGLGVNQRMYEVLGVGSFMLTREAPNFEEDFPGRLFGTYRDTDKCIEKIRYFLNHPEERKHVARAGQEYVLEHYNYRDIVRDFDRTIRKHLHQ